MEAFPTHIQTFNLGLLYSMQRVSEAYRRLSQQPRDYAAGARAGSAVPWSNPIPSNKYGYIFGPEAVPRSQSVLPGAHGTQSLPRYRGISREDRNWLLNTAASARCSERGSVRPEMPATNVGHEADAMAPANGLVARGSTMPHPPSVTAPEEEPTGAAGPGASPEAPSLSQRAEKESDPRIQSAAHLDNWFLKLVNQGPPPGVIRMRPEARRLSQWITVSGFKREDENHMPWNTSAIATIVAADHVQTSSGTVYGLVGPMDQDRTREQGFSAETASAFEDGFPKDWVDILVSDLSQLATAAAQTSASSAHGKPAIANAGDGVEESRRVVHTAEGSLDRPPLNDFDEDTVASSPSAGTRSRRSMPGPKQQQRQAKANPSPALKKRGSSPRSAPSSAKRVRLAVPRSDSEKSTSAATQRDRRGWTSPRARASGRRPSATTPRSPRSGPAPVFDASRSVPRELSMLTKSPFGVMRAVKSALASSPEIRESDVFTDTPTRPSRSRGRRTSEQGADSSPTQWATADEGETPTMTPGRRSLRSRRVSSGQWWVVPKSEAHDESEDEAPYAPETCSPSVVRARKISKRPAQPAVDERPPAPSPLQPRNMRSLPALSFASPRNRATAKRQSIGASIGASPKAVKEKTPRSAKRAPPPKPTMIAPPSGGQSPEAWSSDDEEWEKDI